MKNGHWRVLIVATLYFNMQNLICKVSYHNFYDSTSELRYLKKISYTLGTPWEYDYWFRGTVHTQLFKSGHRGVQIVATLYFNMRNLIFKVSYHIFDSKSEQRYFKKSVIQSLGIWRLISRYSLHSALKRVCYVELRLSQTPSLKWCSSFRKV